MFPRRERKPLLMGRDSEINPKCEASWELPNSAPNSSLDFFDNIKPLVGPSHALANPRAAVPRRKKLLTNAPVMDYFAL